MGLVRESIDEVRFVVVAARDGVVRIIRVNECKMTSMSWKEP